MLVIITAMDGRGRNACVSLYVEDADAYYREWNAKVPIKGAVKNEAWVDRTLDLLYPSGNTIL